MQDRRLQVVRMDGVGADVEAEFVGAAIVEAFDPFKGRERAEEAGRSGSIPRSPAEVHAVCAKLCAKTTRKCPHRSRKHQIATGDPADRSIQPILS